MPYKDKEDQKKYDKQYRRKNREKIKEYKKKWRNEHKEEIRERRKRYYKNNLEKVKERQKEYHKKNPEKNRERAKQWAKNNPGKTKRYRKQWRKDNLERLKILKKRWVENNREHCRQIKRQWREDNRKHYRQIAKQWRQDNLERARELARNWNRVRRKIDLKFSLNSRIRDMIYRSLRGNKAGRSWESLTGYNLTDLIKRLNKTMPVGFTWQDFLSGELHIDHIIPISAFNYTKPEHIDFKRCWALSNLRLLPAKENKEKYNKLDRPFQPALKM